MAPSRVATRVLIRLVKHGECVDALERELDRFATLMITADPHATVPACPEWTVTDLVEHLGIIHRWVTEMVRQRAPVRLPREEMTFDRPTGPDDLGPWLQSGGAALVSVLRAAGTDDAMWAWGPHQSVRFWSRRQLHETAIHRIDLAQASGAPAQLEPALAHDSILELLDFLPHAVVFLPAVEQLRGTGETIVLQATDFDGVGTITLTPDGFTYTSSVGAPTVEDADVALAGPVSELALVMSRRREVGAPPVELRGRRELFEHWIDHSALL
jgi:uncharacterized protein (TIGR03083 family)